MNRDCKFPAIGKLNFLFFPTVKLTTPLLLSPFPFPLSLSISNPTRPATNTTNTMPFPPTLRDLVRLGATSILGDPTIFDSGRTTCLPPSASIKDRDLDLDLDLCLGEASLNVEDDMSGEWPEAFSLDRPGHSRVYLDALETFKAAFRALSQDGNALGLQPAQMLSMACAGRGDDDHDVDGGAFGVLGEVLLGLGCGLAGLAASWAYNRLTAEPGNRLVSQTVNSKFNWRHA